MASGNQEEWVMECTWQPRLLETSKGRHPSSNSHTTHYTSMLQREACNRAIYQYDYAFTSARVLRSGAAWYDPAADGEQVHQSRELELIIAVTIIAVQRVLH